MSNIAIPPLTGIRDHAGRALGWWLAELRGLYTDTTRRLRELAGNPLTIEAGERHWIVRRRQRRLGEVDWDEGDTAGRQQLRELVTGRPAIVVEIPHERVLGKSINLPPGAQSELDGILAFEIARHFPLPAERMFWRHRILNRSPLRVEIVAVPRDIVATITDELAAAGLRANSVALVPAGGAAPLFLPADALARRGASAPRRYLLAVVALLAVATLISWPLAQRVRLAAIENEIATLKPSAEAALRARQDARRAADRDAAIARLQAGRAPLIALLDTLSRELPDGSWLGSLSIAGRDVVLDGLAPSAAGIALALGRNPNFAGVAFRSPIARDPATGLERFQLGAVLGEQRP